MRRPALLVVSTLALASIVACERRPPSLATSPAHEPTAAQPPAPDERPSEAAPVALAEPREVAFETLDHVTIAATFYPGASPEAPAVVLVHQLGSSRAEWAAVIDALREGPALAVLAIDMRGHGASTQRGGAAISYGDFDADAWARTSDDVSAAVQWLRSPETSGVRPSRIALVGASIGATAVVRAAAEDRSLDVIATLSPGRAYRGVDSILVAVHMGPRAFLGVASREETDCAETAEALARITGGRTEIVDGRAHGVAMLGEHTDLTGHVVSFLRESLAAPPVVRPGEAPVEPTGGAIAQ